MNSAIATIGELLVEKSTQFIGDDGEMGSSIGNIGDEPVLASSQRKKTFRQTVVNVSTIDALRADFERYKKEIESDDSEATRLSLRCVVEDDLIPELPGREAVIPLSRGCSLAYLGFNARTRLLSPEQSRDLEARRLAALTYFGAGGGTNEQRLRQRTVDADELGYSIAIVETQLERTALVHEHLDAVAELLRSFHYGVEEVLAIVQDPANVLAVTEHDGTVVGVVVAETATVNLHGDPRWESIVLGELTDSSVSSLHIGRSLQLLMHARLVAVLSAREGSPDLIFSESVYGASLNNAALLGRSFVGRLPNHAMIDLGAQQRTQSTYQSLEVTYLPERATRQVSTIVQSTTKD